MPGPAPFCARGETSRTRRSYPELPIAPNCRVLVREAQPGPRLSARRLLYARRARYVRLVGVSYPATPLTLVRNETSYWFARQQYQRCSSGKLPPALGTPPGWGVLLRSSRL